MNRESINRYIKREHAIRCSLENHADCGIDKLKDINGGYILVDNGDGAKIKKWGFLNIPEPKLSDLTKIAPEEVSVEKNELYRERLRNEGFKAIFSNITLFEKVFPELDIRTRISKLRPDA